MGSTADARQCGRAVRIAEEAYLCTLLPQSLHPASEWTAISSIIYCISGTFVWRSVQSRGNVRPPPLPDLLTLACIVCPQGPPHPQTYGRDLCHAWHFRLCFLQSTSCSLLSHRSRADKAVVRLPPVLSKYGISVMSKLRSKVGRDNYSVLLPASAGMNLNSGREFLHREGWHAIQRMAFGR